MKIVSRESCRAAMSCTPHCIMQSDTVYRGSGLGV